MNSGPYFCPSTRSSTAPSPRANYPARSDFRDLTRPPTRAVGNVRRPFVLFLTRRTTASRALAMSAGERRARRPPFVFLAVGADARATVAVVFVDDPRGRPGPRREAPPDSAWRSWRLAPLMASRTALAKLDARESRAERRVGIGADATRDRPSAKGSGDQSVRSAFPLSTRWSKTLRAFASLAGYQVMVPFRARRTGTSER